MEQTLKPIFHQNAKRLALGTFASANAKDSTFALPNAKNTNMLVSLALGDAHFLCRPCTFHFFGVDFYPTRISFPVEYWLRWVPGVGSLRWACTFHALGDANCTQSKPVFWWNMGFKGPVPRGTPVPTDQFEKGAFLADNQTCYFIFGRNKLSFGAKTTVQCSNQLKLKIALKFSIK